MNQAITIQVPAELSEWLDTEAKRSGVSQGKFVRDQLLKARSETHSKKFMKLAGTVNGPKNLSQRKGFSNA
jgi:hypothetical protein